MVQRQYQFAKQCRSISFATMDMFRVNEPSCKFLRRSQACPYGCRIGRTVCHHYVRQGTCRYGHTCRFAHIAHGSYNDPVSSTSSSSVSVSEPLSSTESSEPFVAPMSCRFVGSRVWWHQRWEFDTQWECLKWWIMCRYDRGHWTQCPAPEPRQSGNERLTGAASIPESNLPRHP